MTQEARISSRIDANLKSKADAVLSQLGIKPSQAIAMFYSQIVSQGGIPFELKIPNAETMAALTEDTRQEKHYTNIDEMFRDLDSDDVS